MKTDGPIWKALRGILVLGLASSLLGIQARPAAASASPYSLTCATQPVRLSLASEQITFCSPTSLPFSAVEDSLSDPNVNYAGVSQLQGYAFANIRAVASDNASGPSMPFYTAGDLEGYRQAVRQSQAAQTNSRLSAAPTASLWGEEVAGLQADYDLSTSLGVLSLRTVEWDLEHDGRLWVFLLTWDTGLPNADEWENAAGHFIVQDISATKLADTAVDLGIVSKTKQNGNVLPQGGPVDVGAPSWWNGICDDVNYSADPATNHDHSSPLGGSWHGVVACGPRPMDRGYLGHLERFFPGAYGEFEFQCLELAMRFLYLEWAISPWAGNAKSIKDSAPSSVIFFANDGTHPIIPGDIITEDGLSDWDGGHAMVVTGVTVDGTGTGTVSILEQNSILDGDRDLPIDEWDMGTDPWTHKHIQGWLHVKANTANGDADPAFVPTGTAFNGPATALGLQTSGKIIVGGEFVGYNGASRNHIARLNADGSLDGVAFNGDGISIASGTAQVMALKVQSDNRVLVGGQFDHYNTTSARANFARLTSDGLIDDTFVPPALMAATSGTPSVNAIAVQSDGKIIIAGNFNTLDGAAHNYIARLNGTTGAVDSGFTAGADGTIYALAAQSDDKILVGGTFSHIGATARSGIARLNSDGTLDTGFNPVGIGPAGKSVNSIAFQSMAATEDRILIAGDFATYNGTARSGIARLNASDGSLDTTFTPGDGIEGTAPYLKTVLAQPDDGRILIGGNFATYNNVSASNFLRLNYDGTRDATFMPRGDFASSETGKFVIPVLLQSDSKILLGGQFTNNIARLLNSFDSCYTLTTAASPPAGGHVDVNPAPNCPGGKYVAGTAVQLSADPNEGLEYIFTNWSGDASGSSTPFTVTMTTNKSITAHFLNPPGAFVKTAPPDDDTPSGVAITLSWGASERATSYEYCMVDITAVESDVCNTEDQGYWASVGSATSVTAVLLPLHTYRWNVRARNQAGTTFSGLSWHFHRDATIPELLYLPLVKR